MNLQVSKNRGRKYLSIVRGYWDSETKKVKHKSVKALGYLDELEKQYADFLATNCQSQDISPIGLAINAPLRNICAMAASLAPFLYNSRTALKTAHAFDSAATIIPAFWTATTPSIAIS